MPLCPCEVQSDSTTTSKLAPPWVAPKSLWAGDRSRPLADYASPWNQISAPILLASTLNFPVLSSKLVNERYRRYGFEVHLPWSGSVGLPKFAFGQSGGSSHTYVQLIGDPGLNTSTNCAQDPTHCHNVGQSFVLSAATEAAALTTSGSNVVIPVRISSIQDFESAITTNGYIDGGITFFGHGAQMEQSDGTYLSLLAPGQGSGVYTNVSALDLNLLTNTQLGPNTTITVKACNAGLRPIKGGGNSIAQLIANQLNRTVYAWKVGMFFSNDPTAAVPTKASGTQPLYMLPLGGSRVSPCLFRPNQPEPQKCGGF